MRIILFASLLTLAACNPKASVDSVPDAKEIANQFFEHFKAGEHEMAISLYREDFWSVIPKETWTKILPNVKAELGNIKQCELINWNQQTKASTDGTGNFVTLQYNCKHEKYDSTMLFSIHKPLSGGESKIIGHNMNSIGFLIE